MYLGLSNLGRRFRCSEEPRGTGAFCSPLAAFSIGGVTRTIRVDFRPSVGREAGTTGADSGFPIVCTMGDGSLSEPAPIGSGRCL